MSVHHIFYHGVGNSTSSLAGPVLLIGLIIAPVIITNPVVSVTNTVGFVGHVTQTLVEPEDDLKARNLTRAINENCTQSLLVPVNEHDQERVDRIINKCNEWKTELASYKM